MCKLKKLGCILLALLVLTNGICNYFLGEVISEGLAIVATLIFFVNKIRFKLHRHLFVPALILVSFIATQVIIILYFNELVRALFLYPYFLFLTLLFIPAYKDNCFTDNSFLIKTFVVFAVISAGYALAQRYGINTILPFESEIRATGLSRSSLNLTGCLLAIFAMGLFSIKDSFKKFALLSIVFFGLMAAGGRGGVISSIIFFIMIYYKKIKNIKIIVAFLFIIFTTILFSADSFLRTFGALNFISDQSNLDRLNSYRSFFVEFEYIGKGVGTTSPAAGRFIKVTGFESSMLNAAYELGIPFVILMTLAGLIWYKSLYAQAQKLIYMFFLGLIPVLAGQQLYGIPSAFCALIIAVYVLTSYREKIVL
jgi:hypothetical protein